MVAPKNRVKNELRPFIPLLVGQGKLARHLAYYLSSLSIPFKHWPNSRNLNEPGLKDLLAETSVAWVLVSDRAIEMVAKQLRTVSTDVLIMHSSATTVVKNTLTLHPLQTFGPELYSLENYCRVPFMFISEEWQTQKALQFSIQNLFKNPTFEISNSNRALYHSYCVMMANFPQLLWDLVESEAEMLMQNPAELFAPILKQTAENFLAFGKAAVTGPLVRGDFATIELHQSALVDSKLSPIYQNFVTTFSKKSSLNKELP